MEDSSVLIPQSLERMGRREKYDSNPAHSSLKDKRELREKLKEKKYKAEQQKTQKKEGTPEIGRAHV